MSIKNILVSYDSSEPAGRAVRFAAALARRFDAHLEGVFAHAAPMTTLQMHPYLTEAALHVMNESLKETEDQCRQSFDDLIAESEAGLRTSFSCIQGYPNDVLARLGRTHDLIVIAQPLEFPSAYLDTSPDDVALRSGRPVLIVPRSFDQFELAEGALLAWDGERAAARALSDAMDLLEDKHKITVLHVGDEKTVRQPGQDIMEHLSRHGIDAELSVQPPGGIATSDIILNTCAETDAGLLVMGAYEHSRFAEIIMGGVTRDIVAKSHVPVLMSH